MLAIASVIDSSGDGVVGDITNGLPSGDSGGGGLPAACFASVSAVVGAALLCAPSTGRRPPEKRDVVDNRDAREPGRSGDAGAGGSPVVRLAFGLAATAGYAKGAGDTGAGAGGEGKVVAAAAGDDALGASTRGGENSALSRGARTGPSACASRRESELDGRAPGELLARPRVGKRREFGGCVTSKVSSTSASGGTGGRADGLGPGDVVGNVSLPSASPGFFPESRRLFPWLGCVQSSTSSM